MATINVPPPELEPLAGRGHPASGALSAFLLMLRLAIGGLFLFAAYQKLQSQTAAQAFVRSVNSFDILPEHLVKLVGFVVPWTEVVTGLAIVFGLWTRAAALLLLISVGVFIWGILDVLSRKASVSCGCFGDFHWPCGQTIQMCHVYRNAAFAGVLLILVLAGGGRFGLDGLFASFTRRRDDDDLV